MVFSVPSLCKGKKAAAQSQSMQERDEVWRARNLDLTRQREENGVEECVECIDPRVKRINKFRKSLNPCFLISAFLLLKAMTTNPSSFYCVELLPEIQELAFAYSF